MKKRILVKSLLAATVVAGSALLLPMGRAVEAQGAGGRQVPTFQVDPAFPQLPNNWITGHVVTIAVDRNDHAWVLHRPRSLPEDRRANAAPAVIEFDPNGKFLQAWGGPGSGYDWPDSEHNIVVDHKDNVWVSGSSPTQSLTTESDDMIVKFDKKGKFLLQIGGRSVSQGSKDPKSVNKPGDLFVYAKTNELFVADGYGNRRVIVFDADTGAYKRMWGAFGKPPEDDATSGGRGSSGGPAAAGRGAGGGRGARGGGAGAGAGGGGGGRGAAAPLDTEGEGSPRFASPVHSIVVSNDDIVYVADRSNRRIQLFTPEGKYISQIFINRAGPASGSASGLALSPDKGQQFLYIADYGNSRVVIVDRLKREVLYQFGTRAATPGNFQGIHHLSLDSKSTLYTAEVAPGARAQRFIFKGMSSTLPPNALTPAQLSAQPQP
jgi:hypothetical protein